MSPRSVIPAALTRMSTRPKALSAAATTALQSFDLGQISRDEASVTTCFGSNAGRHGCAFVLGSAARDDAGSACVGQLSRNCCAETLGASRDDGDLSVDTIHVSCPFQ